MSSVPVPAWFSGVDVIKLFFFFYVADTPAE
jgi:hypothetical protein